MFENIWELWHYRGVTVDTEHMLFIIRPRSRRVFQQTRKCFQVARKSLQCMLNKHDIDGYFDNISPQRCMVNCDKPFRLIERIFPFHYLCVNFHFWLFFQLREFLNYTENWIIFNETYPLWLAFQKKRRDAMKWALIHYETCEDLMRTGKNT